jgi:hypothetical protein
MGKMNCWFLGRSCLKEITTTVKPAYNRTERDQVYFNCRELHFIRVLEFGSFGLHNLRIVKVFP